MKRVAIILAWTSIGFVAGVAATLITLALLLSREEPKLTPTPNREHRLFPWRNCLRNRLDSRVLPANYCSGHLATGSKLPE